MRKAQRLGSARAWIESGAHVTVMTYAKRYGVDKYTAYDELTAIGFPLPDSARNWAQRPARAPKKPVSAIDDSWIMLDGRPFFVVGHTPGGAPFGLFEEEMDPP
jgi:hypothetical protein